MEFVSRVIHAVTVLHPTHVMAVHFPIALTTAALLFVVLALIFRSRSLEQAAFYNNTLVFVTTLFAAASGIQTNLTDYAGAAPNSNVKFFLAATLAVLSLLLLIGRLSSSRILWKPNTMLLYVAGFAFNFALAATLGFLGGVIIYGF
jgi:uncharacterized membrane protein